MKSPHLLNLGNPRKVKYNLSGLLGAAALERIESEIAENTDALISLARAHYRFAVRQSSPNWRQKISRLYYAGYSASRAVRLYVNGEYSRDVQDHQKFGNLPEDFPHKSTYINKLAILREDRNTCDYDHMATASDLVLGSRASIELIRNFLDDVTAYLSKKPRPSGTGLFKTTATAPASPPYLCETECTS